MNLTPQQLEEIVVRVVGEFLTSAGTSRPDEKKVVQATAAPVTAAPVAKPVDTALVLEQTVITADILQDRVKQGTKRIRIAPRAVLTPSARDYLRHANIVCVRDEPAAKSATAAGRWVVLVSSAAAAVSPAVEALRESGVTWEQKVTGTAEEAAKQAVGILCRGEATGVVVVSKAPEVVACLANRNDQIRAAVTGCVRTVDAAKRKIGANLIAIHPGTKGSFELRNMLKTFAESLPVAPAGW